MTEIDKRGKLTEEPFAFRTAKDGRVFIHWHGRRVLILKGAAAEKFISALAKADVQQTQLLMARITGHFKHGNEK